MSQLSNCICYALHRFLDNANGHILIRLTRRSKFSWVAPRWMQWTVVVCCLLPSLFLFSLALWILFGRWPHMAYGARQDGIFEEYLPNEGPERIIPPPFFRGYIQQFDVCKQRCSQLSKRPWSS